MYEHELRRTENFFNAQLGISSSSTFAIDNPKIVEKSVSVQQDRDLLQGLMPDSRAVISSFSTFVIYRK